MPIRKISWLKSLPFLIVHFLALGVFFFPFDWKWVALCVGSYYLRMFAITAGYHRYFSHRSYEMNRISQFFMALLGTTSVQKGVLWWAANHRHHHKYSDQPNDIHSPLQHGFWWSHMGWIMATEHEPTQWTLIKDFERYPELRWLNRYYFIPQFLYALGMYLAWGMPGLFWGFFLSTTLLWHGTFTINSLSHVFGSQRYVTSDTSKNNFWLSLLTLGEGWHNNHHTYMSSARQGFFWWEIDISYTILTLLSRVGVVKNLRSPPLKNLEARLISRQNNIALERPAIANSNNQLLNKRPA